MRQRRLLSLAAPLLVGAIVLSACGDDDDGGGGTNVAKGDGTFIVGTLLPETGSLAFLGPPEVAGVKLAVKEVNDAGGVLGKPMTLVTGDSGDTSTDIANQTVDRLLTAKADVIVGAASSSVTLTVIDKIAAAGVVMFSPANTSKALTTYADKGMYFRTAPPDNLQGQVLGEIVVEDGGGSAVGILALQDPYGEGLAEDTKKSIESSGGKVVETVIYDPKAANFDNEVDRIKRKNPKAVIVIGFDESAKVITTMIEKGIGPDKVKVYGSDGNMGNALGDAFKSKPGALKGMRGTTPLVELSADFQTKVKAVDPKLKDVNYAGESYDAVIISALAAEAAKSDLGHEIAKQINAVTKDGEKCTTFAQCRDLIKAGKDIDYDGISGPLDFVDAGEPGKGSYGLLEFNANNKVDTKEYRTAG